MSTKKKNIMWVPPLIYSYGNFSKILIDLAFNETFGKEISRSRKISSKNNPCFLCCISKFNLHCSLLWSSWWTWVLRTYFLGICFLQMLFHPPGFGVALLKVVQQAQSSLNIVHYNLFITRFVITRFGI